SLRGRVMEGIMPLTGEVEEAVQRLHKHRPRRRRDDDRSRQGAVNFEMINPALDPKTPSPVIKGVTWAPAASVIRLAKGKGADGSDIWATTWADDGDLYTAYGDGFGFDPITDEKLSMGFARVAGVPPHIQ